MAGLIVLGGILHPPNNYDALSYRIPRILNWLAENQWHWIHTQDARMNVRICGSEWLLTPFLALTKSDRWVFLINIACYLLLPGLLFSAYSRLGLRKKVAWQWMWLIPSGYNFILQAGGSANDILGAVYVLAAMSFALRARQTRRWSDVGMAILAAALLTGSKSSNLPLLLPIGLALLPVLRLLLTNLKASFAVGAVAILVSIIPTSIINIKYSGDWTGSALESRGSLNPLSENADTPKNEHTTGDQPEFVFMASNPLMGISGNTLMVLCDNLLPPIFPPAKWWNAHVTSWLPEFYRSRLKDNFTYAFLFVRELPGEETTGLGFGVCWLLVFACVAAWIYRRAAGRSLPPHKMDWQLSLLRWSPVLAMLVFMSKNGMAAATRLLVPYFVLLIPALLAGNAQLLVIRRGWWRKASLAVYLLAYVVVILAPERPLWPAQTILATIERQWPDNRMVKRAQTVYAVYADRYDVFAPIRDALPADARTVGFVCIYDEAGASLWRPFGQRRIRQVLLSDKREALNRWGINYIVARNFGPRSDSWLKEINGERVNQISLSLFASRPPITWDIVRLHHGPP